MTADDSVEVTHRLNAFLEALAPLTELPSGGPEAVPAPIDPDGGWHTAAGADDPRPDRRRASGLAAD
jgi:hypothetical protein